MTQEIQAREEFVDTGRMIHRRVRLAGIEQPFTIEGCQDDQQKGPAGASGRRASEPLVVERALALQYILAGERQECSVCRPTLPVPALGEEVSGSVELTAELSGVTVVVLPVLDIADPEDFGRTVREYLQANLKGVA